MKLKESFIPCALCEKMMKVSEYDHHIYIHLYGLNSFISRIIFINVPKIKLK